MNYSDFVRACARRLAAVVFISMSLAAARAAYEHADAAEPVADAAAVAALSSVPIDVANAVVKVFSTMRYPDPSRPWTKQVPSEVTASGVVIDGKRILTNVYVVLFASQVQVQANQAGDKI